MKHKDLVKRIALSGKAYQVFAEIAMLAKLEKYGIGQRYLTTGLQLSMN